MALLLPLGDTQGNGSAMLCCLAPGRQFRLGMNSLSAAQHKHARQAASGTKLWHGKGAARAASQPSQPNQQQRAHLARRPPPPPPPPHPRPRHPHPPPRPAVAGVAWGLLVSNDAWDVEGDRLWLPEVSSQVRAFCLG